MTQAGPRVRAAERALPDRRARLPVWGSNPTNPDNLCGQKVLAFGADRTELVPTANVACGLQPAQLWNPVDNPTGERCGIADFMRAIFGVNVTPDAPNGKGRLAVDNVGVQYGLARCSAARSRRSSSSISTRRSAGWTSTGTSLRSARSRTRTALEIAYKTGRVNSGTGAANIPEIDNRTGAQMDDTGFHPAFHSFTYRARLDGANGGHANQVIWLSRTGGVVPIQFDAMRAWLTRGVKPGRATRASWPAASGRPDLQRDLDVLRRRRATRRARRSRSTSSSARSSRWCARTTA